MIASSLMILDQDMAVFSSIAVRVMIFLHFLGGAWMPRFDPSLSTFASCILGDHQLRPWYRFALRYHWCENENGNWTHTYQENAAELWKTKWSIREFHSTIIGLNIDAVLLTTSSHYSLTLSTFTTKKTSASQGAGPRYQ